MSGISKLPAPIREIKSSLVSKILWEAWPKKYFRSITDYGDCKLFYNSCFKIASKMLDECILNYNAFSLIRESVIQLELWTIIHHDESYSIKEKIPHSYAAAGRYGWRYVIEKSLENSKTAIPDRTKKIETEDLEIIFTLFFIANNCAELSNYLHFLPNFLASIEVRFAQEMILGRFDFNDSDEKDSFNNLRDYISYAPSKEDYKQFQPSSNNELIRDSVDKMLSTYYQCTLSQIDEFVLFIHNVTSKLFTLILIQPLESFVNLALEKTSLSEATIRGIIRLSFLDTDHPQYQQRDFLTKSQHYRLLNYSGLIVELTNNFQSIYDEGNALKPFVTNSLHHVIVSAVIIDDWKNGFILRLLFGQRGDLKLESPGLKKAVIEIEHLYHNTIFEQETMHLLKKRGFEYILNLKKIDKKDISCGEIDGLAYHAKSNTLLIMEMKNLVPSTDARSMGQIVSDHFRAKKYHDKFLKKIKFVKDNLDAIIKVFNSRGIKIEKIDVTKMYFITNTGNVTKFMVNEYEIMRYDELDKLISNEY